MKVKMVHDFIFDVIMMIGIGGSSLILYLMSLW
jgi:glucose-6-phosphate isomerase